MDASLISDTHSRTGGKSAQTGALDNFAIHQWPQMWKHLWVRCALSTKSFLLLGDFRQGDVPPPQKDKSKPRTDYILIWYCLFYCLGNNAVESNDWLEGLRDFYIVKSVHLENSVSLEGMILQIQRTKVSSCTSVLKSFFTELRNKKYKYMNLANPLLSIK